MINMSQTQEIKLRYQVKNSYYMPEYSYDGTTWKIWTENDLKDLSILRLIVHGLGTASVNYELSYENNFFGNTKGLFFRNEICCNAFLGAAKIFYKKEIIEFENIN